MNFREVLRLGRGCLRSRDCALKTREVYSNLDSARIRGTSEYLTWLQLNCQPAGCNTILTHGFLYFFPHMTCTYYVREQKLGSKQKLWGEGERGAGREVTKPGEKPSRPVTSHEEIWECLLIRIETPLNREPPPSFPRGRRLRHFPFLECPGIPSLLRSLDFYTQILNFESKSGQASDLGDQKGSTIRCHRRGVKFNTEVNNCTWCVSGSHNILGRMLFAFMNIHKVGSEELNLH